MLGIMDFHQLAVELLKLSELCERAALDQSPQDPEYERCAKVLEALKAYPQEAIRLLVDFRKEAKDAGREQGVMAMRDALASAHERYMNQLSVMQTKLDARGVSGLSGVGGATSLPAARSTINSRRWVGCSDPKHAHRGDPDCPECLWQ